MADARPGLAALADALGRERRAPVDDGWGAATARAVPAAVHASVAPDRRDILAFMDRPACCHAARRHHDARRGHVQRLERLLLADVRARRATSGRGGRRRSASRCRSAIGAAVAAPGRRVLAFMGDGGFGFTAMELATAVTYGIERHRDRPQRQRVLVDRQLPAGRPRPRVPGRAAQPGLRASSPGPSGRARSGSSGGRTRPRPSCRVVARARARRSSRSPRRSSRHSTGDVMRPVDPLPPEAVVLFVELIGQAGAPRRVPRRPLGRRKRRTRQRGGLPAVRRHGRRRGPQSTSSCTRSIATPMRGRSTARRRT